MTFKITIETNDLAGVEAIVNQLHSLEQQGANTQKVLSTSPQELQQNTTQIYPPQQALMLPTQAPIQQVPVTQPVQQMPVIPPAQHLPTATKTYDVNELSLASRPIVEAGRQEELLNFLHSFTFIATDGTIKNVQSIMDLPKEKYGEFATGLRQMGGKI